MIKYRIIKNCNSTVEIELDNKNYELFITLQSKLDKAVEALEFYEKCEVLDSPLLLKALKDIYGTDLKTKARETLKELEDGE